MLNLLIADDEEEIRMGILNTIKWEENGIHICGLAGNGKETIEKIEQLHPEIVLLDIRMPVLGGLQVLEHINRHRYGIKTIILSGYDHFSYAQTAIKNGASDFLLKPCQPEEILSTVLKVKAQVEEELGKDTLLQGLKIRFNESLPLLKEIYLTKLLRSGGRQKLNFSENARLYGINLNDADISAAVIKIDDSPDYTGWSSSDDDELFKFAVKNIAGEILSAALKCEIIQSNDEIIAIYNNGNYGPIYELFDEVREYVRKFMRFTVSIGIGGKCRNVENLPVSYAEALKSIEATFSTGGNAVIKYEDIKEFDSCQSDYPVHEEAEILNAVVSGKPENVEGKLRDFFTVLGRANFSKDLLLKSSLALMMSLYHLCIEKNIDTEDIFGNFQLSISSFLKCNSLSLLEARLTELSGALCRKLGNKMNSNKIIEQSVAFIDKNFNKDLNLETVAGNVFITSGYLSLLFKQKLGINFVDYLHKVRIMKACELMKDMQLKTYEIAYKVGFNDEKYFSQLFKKYTSMTPTQYKSTL